MKKEGLCNDALAVEENARATGYDTLDRFGKDAYLLRSAFRIRVEFVTSFVSFFPPSHSRLSQYPLGIIYIYTSLHSYRKSKSKLNADVHRRFPSPCTCTQQPVQLEVSCPPIHLQFHSPRGYPRSCLGLPIHYVGSAPCLWTLTVPSLNLTQAYSRC